MKVMNTIIENFSRSTHLQAPPNEVSPEARKQAETLYESAHQQLPLDDILNFLTNCNDAYLQHSQFFS